MLVLTLLLLVTLAAAVGWVVHELRTPYYASAEPETYVNVPRGAGPGTIAGLMERAGVLHTRLPFLLYIRWINGARHLQAGEYRFVTPASPVEVADRLMRGDVHYVSVTIPEGLTAVETIDQISRAGLGNLEDLGRALRRTDWIREINPSARTLEGYLFPETYRFSRHATSDEVVKALVDEFRLRFTRLTEAHPVRKGWNAGKIVILASMIEKEVRSPGERPLVASVLVNRLERGIPLACDPTIIYALKLEGRYDGNLHKEDLSVNSPYNTYIHAGLPPGPIANPGEGSLEAALCPANTEYLYYVSRNDGTHQFSRDFQAHLSAVARFQKPLVRHDRPVTRRRR